jgi:hypothetical protein
MAGIRRHLMNMRITMSDVPGMLMGTVRTMVVNVGHSGFIKQKAIRGWRARQRQRNSRRHDAQQINQRNRAACSQSLNSG